MSLEDRFYRIKVSPEDRFYCIEVSLVDRFYCIEVSPEDRFYCIEVSAVDRFYCIEVSAVDRFYCIEVSPVDRFYCILLMSLGTNTFIRCTHNVTSTYTCVPFKLLILFVFISVVNPAIVVKLAICCMALFYEWCHTYAAFGEVIIRYGKPELFYYLIVP